MRGDPNPPRSQMRKIGEIRVPDMARDVAKANAEDGTLTRGRARRLRESATEEMRRFVVLFLYLWLLFGLFVLNESIQEFQPCAGGGPPQRIAVRQRRKELQTSFETIAMAPTSAGAGSLGSRSAIRRGFRQTLSRPNAARQALYRQVVAAYLQDVPHLFPYNLRWLWGATKGLHGFIPVPDGLFRPEGVTLGN
ncbi:MAG: hypothetical protein ACREFJ_05395 [Acetobacteraceae bacterium]